MINERNRLQVENDRKFCFYFIFEHLGAKVS